MFALWVIEQFNVFKDITPRFVARSIFPPPDLLALQELKEALIHCVVMAIAPAAHRVFQTVLAQKRRPFTASSLWTCHGIVLLL